MFAAWVTLSQQDLEINTSSALQVCWGCGAVGKDSWISSCGNRGAHQGSMSGSVWQLLLGCERRAATLGISLMQLLPMKTFDGGNF